MCSIKNRAGDANIWLDSDLFIFRLLDNEAVVRKRAGLLILRKSQGYTW